MTWSDFHSQRISGAALWAINCRDYCNNPEEQWWWLWSVWQRGGRWEVGICTYFGDRAPKHFWMKDVRGWDSQEYLGLTKNGVSTLSWDEDCGWKFRLKEGNSEFILGLLNLKHLLDIPGEISSRHWTLWTWSNEYVRIGDVCICGNYQRTIIFSHELMESPREEC